MSGVSIDEGEAWKRWRAITMWFNGDDVPLAIIPESVQEAINSVPLDIPDWVRQHPEFEQTKKTINDQGGCRRIHHWHMDGDGHLACMWQR